MASPRVVNYFELAVIAESSLSSLWKGWISLTAPISASSGMPHCLAIFTTSSPRNPKMLEAHVIRSPTCSSFSGRLAPLALPFCAAADLAGSRVGLGSNGTSPGFPVPLVVCVGRCLSCLC